MGHTYSIYLTRILARVLKSYILFHASYILQDALIIITTKIFKCKICDAELPNEQRLKNHMKVHNRKKKSKIYEYGDPYLDYLGKQGIQAGFR